MATLDWHEVWRDDRHGGWLIEAATRADGGATRDNLRLTVGGHDGALAICRDGERILLVKIWRPAVDAELWELPRGLGEPGEDAAETAARELAEETGVEARPRRDLGVFYPDSGVLGQSCGVVVVSPEQVRGDDDGEVLDRRWCTPAEIDDLIRAGELRDGASLAALLLLRVADGDDPVRPRS